MVRYGMMSRCLLAGLGLEQDHDKQRRDKRNGSGNLCTCCDLMNIYHSSKARSNRMAMPVVSIQKNTWYVKSYQVVKSGISMRSAAVIFIRIAEATRTHALNNCSSCIRPLYQSLQMQ